MTDDYDKLRDDDDITRYEDDPRAEPDAAEVKDDRR